MGVPVEEALAFIKDFFLKYRKKVTGVFNIQFTENNGIRSKTIIESQLPSYKNTLQGCSLVGVILNARVSDEIELNYEEFALPTPKWGHSMPVQPVIVVN